MFLLTESYSIFHPSPSVEAEKRHYSMRDHYTVVCVWMFRGHESTINSQRRLFWSDPFPYWVDLNEMEPRQTPGRRVVLSFSFTGKDIDWFLFFRYVEKRLTQSTPDHYAEVQPPSEYFLKFFGFTHISTPTNEFFSFLHCHTWPFSTVDTKPVPRWTVVQYFQEVFVLQFLYLSRKYHLGLKSTDCIAADTRLWACNC